MRISQGLLPTFVAAYFIGVTPAAAQDADLDRVAELLSGSWKSTAPVQAIEGTPEAVILHVAPVELEGFGHALYAEMTRESEPTDPYRQVIYELYRFGDEGTIRLRTHEFRRAAGIGPALLGMWAVPEIFPQLDRGSLHATLDVELSASGNGFAGQTPCAYPTAWLGAVEMTSRVEIQEGRFVAVDEGIAADGSTAWGGGSGVTFEPFDPGITVEDFGEGLYAIDFVKGDGEVAADGDDVTVHYSGWVLDLESEIIGGSKFDSSYDRPTGPQPFTFPLPGRLIEGWNRAAPGVRAGGVRRLIIPGDLAYGPRGRPGIPPNATLFFTLEILDVVKGVDPTGAEMGVEGDGN
ncbi:MAG: CpcT/CpeT family chromophore lyase [Planctomycetota bacterium]